MFMNPRRFLAASALGVATLPIPKGIRTKDAPGLEEAMALHVKAVETMLAKHSEDSEKQALKLAELDSCMFDLSQRQAQMRAHGGSSGDWFGGGAGDTWGAQFARNPDLDAMKGVSGRPGQRVELSVKTITSAGGSGGALADTGRDGLVVMPRQRLVIRDLLTVIPVQTGQVEYPYQTGRTNNADMQVEGQLKAESNLTFDLKTVPVRTIAHWIMASRQVLDDAPQLEGLIDSELTYGLDIKEELEILYGDGSGQHLNGIVKQSTAYDATIGTALGITATTAIDKIGLALLQADLANLPADGIVMHPSDWTAIRLLKDGDGNYILGSPLAAGPATLFGRPVVTTQAMQLGKFLVGAFAMGATLYDRMAATVLASTEDRDNFVKNMVTILGEERVAFAVKQPTGFIYGAFR